MAIERAPERGWEGCETMMRDCESTQHPWPGKDVLFAPMSCEARKPVRKMARTPHFEHLTTVAIPGMQRLSCHLDWSLIAHLLARLS